MSRGSSLLRLLLCVVLAFNGLAFNGVPTARADMHPEHGVPLGAVQAAAPESMDGMAGMPCHDMDQGGLTDQAAADADPDDDKAPTPDCCKDKCQCACMQHATPAITLAAFSARIVHDSVQLRATTAHAPPTLSRLNRPPIG
jgi:hypothetical protein